MSWHKVESMPSDAPMRKNRRRKFRSWPCSISRGTAVVRRRRRARRCEMTMISICSLMKRRNRRVIRRMARKSRAIAILFNEKCRKYPLKVVLQRQNLQISVAKRRHWKRKRWNVIREQLKIQLMGKARLQSDMSNVLSIINSTKVKLCQYLLS